MSVAQVRIWDHLVGFVSWDGRRKQAYFEFEPGFLELGFDLAPMTIPLESVRKYPRIIEGNKDKLYRGLPPMLADSLPDRYGERLFATWQRQFFPNKKTFDPVERLCYLGSRGLGALEYLPATQTDMDEVTLLELDEIYRVAIQLFAENPLTTDRVDSHQLAALIKVGTSPGGKHPKALIAIDSASGAIRSGQGAVPDGYEHWLFKFDMDRYFPYGKVEMAYYLLAVEAGVEMMPSRLHEEKGRSHFMTRRFDRVGNMKVHLQTLAAMQPSAVDYEDIFAVMRKLKLPYQQHEQLYRRLIFNVVARNIDDHNKNFSFLMDSQGDWRLAPAYDLLFTYSPADPDFMNHREMSVNGKVNGITKADLFRIGIDNGINQPGNIWQEVVAAVSRWEHHAHQLDIPEPVQKLVTQHLLLS